MSEEKKNMPLAADKNIAVFAKELPSGDTAFVVAEGPQGNRQYTTVFPEVGGHKLSADEVLGLFLGYDIEADLTAKNNPEQTYTASLALKGIKSTTRKTDAGVYVNRIADIGIALHRNKKEDGEHFGYKVDGVDFFKTVGPQNRRVELFARDCFQLLQNKPLVRDGVQIALREVETNQVNGRTVKTARLSTQVIQSAEDITADAPSEGEGVKV